MIIKLNKKSSLNFKNLLSAFVISKKYSCKKDIKSDKTLLMFYLIKLSINYELNYNEWIRRLFLYDQNLKGFKNL